MFNDATLERLITLASTNNQDLALAQAVIYLSVAPKSDAAYRALGAVREDPDTRALTALIREKGMPNAVIAHNAGGTFDNSAHTRTVTVTGVGSDGQLGIVVIVGMDADA